VKEKRQSVGRVKKVQGRVSRRSQEKNFKKHASYQGGKKPARFWTSGYKDPLKKRDNGGRKNGLLVHVEETKFEQGKSALGQKGENPAQEQTSRRRSLSKTKKNGLSMGTR